jgi:putative redox protein
MEMKITFPGNLKVDAAYKGFTVETDQPVSGGGDGSAPAPLDLFLASLGTCAGIFMLAFMKQRGIDPAGSGIAMITEVDPEKGMIGRIAFDQQAIVRAVDQCTVKRHIQDPPEFTVTTSRALPA